MSSSPKPPVMERTRVIADTMSQSWRVLCPVHGEVSRYRAFWPANRDAREHDSVCPLVTGVGDVSR